MAVGMSVSAASAAVSSFDGLRSLALLAGWNVYMAPLLPLTIDAYAMSATRVWLADTLASERARRFARRNAVGAILASLVGNATYHAIAAGILASNWMVVVVVGAVPPVVLGLVSHLAVLRKQPDAAVPQSVPGTAVVPADGTRYRTEDELLVEARAADAAWRRDHDDRPISRDALRKELRVGAARATDVLRRLRAEPNHQTSQQEAHAQ
ncbi:hypothetical protein GCM10027575_45300 [Phytohabitans suffuscus]